MLSIVTYNKLAPTGLTVDSSEQTDRANFSHVTQKLGQI